MHMEISVKENRLCRFEKQSPSPSRMGNMGDNFDVNPSATQGLKNFTILEATVLDKHGNRRRLTKEEMKRIEEEESRKVAETLGRDDPGEQLLSPNLSDEERAIIEEYLMDLLLAKLEHEKYDFNKFWLGETSSRTDFAKEVIWICKKLKKNPSKIVWKEIFPTGSGINYTRTKTYPLAPGTKPIRAEIDADTYNENLKVLEKVEIWVKENL